MKHSIGLGIVAAVLGLAACGSREGAGGVSAEEARQLNEAAEMLDASPDSLVANEQVGLGNGEENAQAGDLPASGEGANGQ